jgi:hypothetical protein
MKHKKKHMKADSSYRREEKMMEDSMHDMQKAEKMGKRRMRSKRHEVRQMHPLMKMGSMAMPHHTREKYGEDLDDNSPKHAAKKHQSKMKHKKKETKGEGKIHKVMKEYGEGKLHSGSKHGPKVKSRKQALAIGYSEARKRGMKVKKSHHKKRK